LLSMGWWNEAFRQAATGPNSGLSHNFSAASSKSLSAVTS
jgi:hypothetical protein